MDTPAVTVSVFNRGVVNCDPSHETRPWYMMRTVTPTRWWDDPSQQDTLVWHIPMGHRAAPSMENARFDPPDAWTGALDAVARDLRCLQFGTKFDFDDLVWELTVNSDYYISIGWLRPGESAGWTKGTGLSIDATTEEAYAALADTVQYWLTGYYLAPTQWPSKGWHLLDARHIRGEAVWVDPHGDTVIATIGSLCENSHTWDGQRQS